MPVDYDYGYNVSEETRARRAALIAKWRSMGCTEGKINKLIQRRMRSYRQWW